MRLALAAALAFSFAACAAPRAGMHKASGRDTARLEKFMRAAKRLELPHTRQSCSFTDLELFNDRVIFRLKSEKTGEALAFTYGLLNDPPKIVKGGDDASVVRIPPWVGERGGLEATYADAAKAQELVDFVQKLRAAAPQE